MRGRWFLGGCPSPRPCRSESGLRSPHSRWAPSGRRLTLTSLLLVFVGAATEVAATPSPTPSCAEVACSGHGQCLTEKEDRYCFCDEGYSAVGLACRRSAPLIRRTVAGGAIARLARGEVGRPLESVGRYRRDYPRRLAEYVPEDALWCSDFVSWVYRAAGTPLSGGYQGGWLVPNNVAMKRWFERHHLWVERGDWNWGSFEPKPGDYIRIRTRTWGHSAIVERVEGETLHLIEGNAGGRVRATRYQRFRIHPKVEGFGIATETSTRRPLPALPGAWLPMRRLL